MPDLLAAIVAGTRTIVDARRTREPLAALERRAAAGEPRGGAFRSALESSGRTNLVAECKRRSPARGVLVRDYDPVALASAYERGGAAAVSVLTEPTFFDGSLADLAAVREAVRLPLLRKDFIVDEYQLYEARAAGADAVLLIAAALEGPLLAHLHGRAADLGLAALVEVHGADELARALDAGASIVGVNSRNLRTLHVDLRVCEELAGQVPDTCVAVAESGLHDQDDLRRLRAAGYQAFLVGEWVACAPDPEALVRSLTAPIPGGSPTKGRQA